ncbi:integrase, catalytic region, zinc finger, CCHC-type containing protein [Tanacetum coccineum]
MSSECNNVKLAIRNDKSEVVCAMCKQCLITANHDVCVLNYLNGMNSRGMKQKENVSNIANQTKLKPKVKKPNKVGSKERLASPKPRKPRTFLTWSPTGRIFYLRGKIIASIESECQSDYSNGDNACCSKHMTGNLKLLINFVWKFLGIVRFGNDQVAEIMGYGDLQWGNILITGVYFVEGLRHNLFSVRQFCDSDFEVTPSSYGFGPMRVESINGKRYVMVIVDDYSRYTWVHFLRSKDEAPEEIKTFLNKITVLLQAPVIVVRTDNGTEFKNQVLKEYFDSVGISHQASSVRTPQQNRVMKRRNRTLVEAARTMLIFSRALLFLWAEVIATACYTQNHSIIHRRFNKTPYELINGRKPDISFLHVFGVLCYPKNDHEDIGKLGAKGDIGFFIGYSATSCAYRVYNLRTKKIIETMNVTFNELSAMAFEQRSSKPGLQSMTAGQITMYDDYIGSQPSASPKTVPAAQAPLVFQTPTTSTTIADTAPTPTNSSSQATNLPNTSQDVD